MRIVHVLPRLDRPAARAVEHLIAGQRYAGHIVTVLQIEPDTEGGPSHTIDTRIATVWSQPHDIVHAHASRAMQAILPHVQTARRRRPVVVTLHDWLSEEGWLPTGGSLDAMVRTSRVAVPAGTAALRLISKGLEPQRIRVIPYPVDPAPEPGPAEQPLLREMVEWRNRGGDVLCAVAHAAGTHHRVVLKALSMLPSRAATMCVLAGAVDGIESARRARELGVHDQVRISHPESDTRVLASRADVAILPGFDERRPFALAEAWCDGVAVLAGRNSQFADLDAHGAGTLFYEHGDAPDLARAISTVRGTTPAGRRLLVDRARALYRLRFTNKAVFDAYMGEYQALIGPSRSVA